MLLNQSMEELFSASATKLRNESVFSQKRPGETCSHGDEVADPLRLENEKLKDENASLRKNANLNNLSLLEAENARLRIENKVLKVQNDALCGKIISDNDKKCEQEQEARISSEDMPLL
ncbi:PREDICTED: uncharacterized protein LOC18594951 isoform X5 [Theobroma cacao]|uniref:Uncharacterized protein LOC18594951 isoform X4 n=1 Tax=Theobroma cacao TaxID=3641 RepID=A0AB32WEB0_THECC|nr:PREDICTED: uncharacterized protein LOC18594951 isoform X4 [Theobroma cacao]XP_017976196.1 PREDICTED: uncharacterized protein LOC18594951 isoform X5 [Theobroma cacao]